jgi:hypothetical protein
LVTQATHWRVAVSQRPPVPASPAMQAASSRQPAAQALSAVQYCPLGQRSSAVVQGTQRPVVVSQAGPPALPAQSVALVQRIGPASVGATSSGPASAGPVSIGPVSLGPVSVGPVSAGAGVGRARVGLAEVVRPSARIIDRNAAAPLPQAVARATSTPPSIHRVFTQRPP